MAYTYLRAVTIDHTKCGGSDTANFTFPFAGTYSFLIGTLYGGDVNNANGYDIGFFADMALMTKLNWEVEAYVATTGEIEAWVKIPNLSHTADTVIYIAYGDPTISTFQGGAVGTAWDAVYKSVYHLSGQGSSPPSFADSTSNGNNGTGYGSGWAINLQGNNHFSNVSQSSVAIAGGTPHNLGPGDTMVVWVYGNAGGTCTVVDGLGNNYHQDLLYQDATVGLRGIYSFNYPTGLPAGTSITANFTGSAQTFGAISACEFNGLLTASYVDQTASQASTSGTTPTSGATGTLSQQNEIAVGIVSGYNTSGIALNWASLPYAGVNTYGWVGLDTGAQGVGGGISAGLLSAWAAVDSTAALTFNPTISPSSAAGCSVVTYKASTTTKPPLNPAGGIIDGAASFNGLNHYVNCGAGASLNIGTGPLTVECWMRTPTAVSYRTEIINKFAFQSGTSTELGWALSVLASGHPRFVLDGTQANGTSFYADSSVAVNDNIVHHLVAVWDPTSPHVYIYVDDALRGQDTALGTVGANFNNSVPQRLAWGAGILLDAALFSNFLDEVRVSTTIRNADYVTQCYNSQANPSTFYSVGGQLQDAFASDGPFLFHDVAFPGPLIADTPAWQFQDAALSGNTVYAQDLAYNFADVAQAGSATVYATDVFHFSERTPYIPGGNPVALTGTPESAVLPGPVGVPEAEIK